MRVPKPWGEIVGAVFGLLFIGFFVVLTVKNLLEGAGIGSMLASALWLLLVGGVIGLWCKAAGPRRFLLELLGAFAHKHFAQAVPRARLTAEIRFGYQFFGHRFCYVRVAADKIAKIDWHTGQVSHMAGRDIGDWQVAVWYEHGNPARSRAGQEQGLARPDQELHLVGPSRCRERTEAFGLALLEFLRAAGAALVPGEDDSTFVRPAAIADGK